MAPSRRRRILFALAGALALPLAIACNGIIGLSDYERVDCTGGRCDGGSTPDGMLPDSTSNPDAETKVDASGSKAVSWAAWKMPNYDAGGPDAPDNPMKFSPTADGLGFVDEVTKLVWRHPMPDTTSRTFADAQKVCALLDPPGTWRLPSRIELVTLLDLGQAGTRIAPVFKTDAGTAQEAYWTFSEVRPFVEPTRQHWVVYFSSVAVLGKKAESDGIAAVRCVRDKT